MWKRPRGEKAFKSPDGSNGESYSGKNLFRNPDGKKKGKGLLKREKGIQARGLAAAKRTGAPIGRLQTDEGEKGGNRARITPLDVLVGKT